MHVKAAHVPARDLISRSSGSSSFAEMRSSTGLLTHRGELTQVTQLMGKLGLQKPADTLEEIAPLIIYALSHNVLLPQIHGRAILSRCL
jgi:hypothetical protein